MTKDNTDAFLTSASTFGSPRDATSGGSGVMVIVGAEKAFYFLIF